jgi:hypothetical protein
VYKLIADIRLFCHRGFEVARITRTIVPDEQEIIFITAFEINSLNLKRCFPHWEGKMFFLRSQFQSEPYINSPKI